jgi:hypothetical protein
VKIKGLFAQSPGWKKLLLLIWFVCLSFVFIYALSIISAYIIWGTRVFDTAFLTDNTNADAVAVMKFMQAFNSLGMFLVPAVLLTYFTRSTTTAGNKSCKGSGFIRYPLVVILALAMLPISNMLAELNQMIVFPDFMSDFENFLRSSEKETEQITHAFIYAPGLQVLFLNLFIIAVIPAIAEEFFFRGALQGIMTQWFRNVHLAIIITAFIFSLIHFQFFTFVPRLFLGVVFGYLMYYTGNIWIPILAHFVNNAAAVIVYYLITGGYLPPESEHVGGSGTVVWFASGLVVSILAFMIICRNTGRQKAC